MNDTITITIPQIVINIYNKQNLNLEQMAHSLDELLALANDQSTKEDSLFTIVNGLKSQLAEAIKNAGTDPAAIQAQVDAVFERFTSNTQKIVDAIAANTPASGSTTPPTTGTGDTTDTGTTVATGEPAPGTGTGGAIDTGSSPTPVDVDTTVPAPPPVSGPTAPGAPTAPGTNADGVTVI